MFLETINEQTAFMTASTCLRGKVENPQGQVIKGEVTCRQRLRIRAEANPAAGFKTPGKEGLRTTRTDPASRRDAGWSNRPSQANIAMG